MPGDHWNRDDWSHDGGPWRWRRRRPPSLVLPIVIGAIQVIGVSVGAQSQPDARPLAALGYLLLLCGPAALVVRRRWPLPVLALTLVAAIAYLTFEYPSGPFALAAIVALFSAAQRAPRAAVWTTTALAYLVYLAATLYWGHLELGTAVAVGAWSAVAVALAEAARVRAEHFAEARRAMAESQRAKLEAERARQEQARRQASDERLRIAQELHDVLGHHLSSINVRAGVALHLIDTQPEQAREALGAIKVASAEALREVRGVLGVLRPADESAPRSPAPSLDHVAHLGEDLGLTVRREGTVFALPAEVDRAAYRIVQESLTNVRRHAGPAAVVTLLIRYEPEELTLVLDDTGSATTATAALTASAALTATAGEGNGIPGMRERATALGGTLSTGPRPGGGFRVVATLPLPSRCTSSAQVPR